MNNILKGHARQAVNTCNPDLSTMLLAALMLLGLMSGSLRAQWQPVNGPWGGNVWALGVSGTSLFANVNGHGYRSWNAATQWIPLSRLDGVITFYKSADGMFAGMPHGILRSTDDGDSWEDVSNGLPDTAVFCFTKLDTLLFAGTAQGVYRSGDGGAHWAPYNAGMNARKVSAMAAVGRDVVAVMADGQYLTRSRGSYWTLLPGGGLNGREIIRLVARADTLIAGASFGGIFRSTDHGGEWSRTDTWPDMLNAQVSVMLYVEDTLFATGGSSYGEASVFYSLDNGSSWHPRGTCDAAVLSMAAEPGYLFLGTLMRGVQRSFDHGFQWEDASFGLGHAYVSSLSQISGAVVAIARNEIMRSSDGGVDWWPAPDDALPGFAYPEMRLHRVGEKLLRTGFYENRISGNGLSWQACDTSLGSSFIPDVGTVGTTSYALTGTGLMLTTDDGDHWVPNRYEPGLSGVYIQHLTASDSFFIGIGYDIIYPYWSDNTIYRCRVNDSMWVKLQKWVPPAPDGLLFWHGGWLFSERRQLPWPGVYVSSDNGAHWVGFDAGLRRDSAVYGFDSVANSVLISTDHGVFITARDSTGWTDINDGLPKGTKVNGFTTINGYLLAATDSDGVWRRPIREVVTTVPLPLGSAWTLHLETYPQPARDEIVVSFPGEHGGLVDVSIEDVLGRRIAWWRGVHVSAGEGLQYDTGGLPPGVYIAVATAGVRRARSRVIIAR